MSNVLNWIPVVTVGRILILPVNVEKKKSQKKSTWFDCFISTTLKGMRSFCAMLKLLKDLQEIVIINVLEPRGAGMAAGLVCLSSA